MSKTFYPIPDDISPQDTLCVTLQVPNSQGHISAFLGAIFNLTKWYSWERDEAKNGVLCGARWKVVYDQLLENLYEGCGTMDVTNFRQTGCDLEALVNGVWTVIYTLNQQCVNDKVNIGIGGGGITINNYGKGDTRIVSDEDEQKTKANSLDEVWGGCLELTEYIFETCNFLLDLLEVAGSASEAVSSILKGANDTIKDTVKDKNGNDTEIIKDVLIGNDGESNVDLPVNKTEPAKGIDISDLLDIFQSILDAGVALLRAGLTETYLETVAGKLFNILTCVENAPRKTSNIILTTDDLKEWSSELTSGTLQDIFVGVVIVAQEIIGTVDFLSLLDLNDAFRQYSLGVLAPNNTWGAIVDPCPTIDIFYREFDFNVDGYGAIFSSAPLFGNPVNRVAKWDAGIGWHFMSFNSGTYRYNGAYVRTVTFPTTTFTRIEFEWQIVKGNGVYHNFVASLVAPTFNISNGTSAKIANNVLTGTYSVNNWNKTTTVFSFGVTGYYLNGVVPNGDVYLKKLRIWSSTPLPPQLLV